MAFDGLHLILRGMLCTTEPQCIYTSTVQHFDVIYVCTRAPPTDKAIYTRSPS